jgi:hypothetical protein
VLGKGPKRYLTKRYLVAHKRIDNPLLDAGPQRRNPLDDTRKDITTPVTFLGPEKRKGYFREKTSPAIVEAATIQLAKDRGKPSLLLVDLETKDACDMTPGLVEPTIA